MIKHNTCSTIMTRNMWGFFLYSLLSIQNVQFWSSYIACRCKNPAHQQTRYWPTFTDICRTEIVTLSSACRVFARETELVISVLPNVIVLIGFRQQEECWALSQNKNGLSRHREFHYRWPSFLYSENSYTDKTVLLYWDPLKINIVFTQCLCSLNGKMSYCKSI